MTLLDLVPFSGVYSEMKYLLLALVIAALTGCAVTTETREPDTYYYGTARHVPADSVIIYH